MMHKYILGNWKMNGTWLMAVPLAKAVVAQKTSAQVVLFPPTLLLPFVERALGNSTVALGGQDASAEKDGAFTGDVSTTMLKDAGCSYVILGHSERRTGHGETSALVRAKARAALAAGLTPVICVGESLEQRESGKFLEIIESQVKSSLPEPGEASLIIAYEPLWAIGTGRTPTSAQISQAHKTIASVLSYATSGAACAIVYGGSVKAGNASEILETPGVDGVLVGGASLNAKEFCAIIAAAR